MASLSHPRSHRTLIGLGFLLLCSSSASLEAQRERSGVRVRYTSIASNGGLEGRAFLPWSRNGVVTVPSERPECTGYRRITMDAALSRGQVRKVHIAASVSTGSRKGPLSGTGCAHSVIEIAMQDGTRITGGQGFVEFTRLPTTADPTYRGRFAQTAIRNGAPITVEGTFVAPVTKDHPQ